MNRNAEDTQKKWGFIDWISVFVFIVAVIFIIGYAIGGTLITPRDYVNRIGDHIYEWKTSWTYTDENGHTEMVSLPGQFDAEPGSVVVLETILPGDVADNLYLCVGSSKQDTQIYIDGKLRMNYTTEDTRYWGKASTYRLLFVELRREDCRKAIRIVSQTSTNYAGTYPVLYIGESGALLTHFIFAYGLEVAVATVMLLAYLFVFALSIAYSLHYRRILDLFHLSVLGIISMVWILCNSRLRQFYMPNATIGNELAHIMLIILPMPLLFYADKIQGYRFHKIYRTIELIVSLNIIVTPLLQIFNLRDYSEMIAVAASLMIFSFVLIYILIIWDFVHNKTFDYLAIACGMFVAGILTTIQFVLYAVKIVTFNGVNVAAGMLVLTVAATYSTIKSIKEAEAEKAEAIAKGKAETAFLANMSHEIRTPINAILGMNELIYRKNKDSEINEYVKDIQSSGETLLALINDVLDESRIRSGKMEIVPVEYSLSKIIHEMQNVFGVKAAEKGLQFIVEVDLNIPDCYFGDDVRIRQVLNNLVSNAIKYTDAGVVSLHIQGSLVDEKEMLHFLVSDTGIGIKEDDKDKLLSAFERVDLKHNRNIQGTGLGLAITANLLLMMGSELKIESVYGIGSQFSFDLSQPVVDMTSMRVAMTREDEAEGKEQNKTLFTAPTSNILVADDNDLNLKVFCKLLEPLQMKIDVAVNGEEAVKLTKEKKYDILFIDHMMPVMDGVEALKRIRGDLINPNNGTKTIALTANAIAGAKERYLEYGFDGFLAKPFVPSDLEAMILKILPAKKIIESNAFEEAMTGFSENEDTTLPEIDGVDWSIAYRNMVEESLILSVVEDMYKGAISEIDSVRRLYSNLYADVNPENYDNYRIKVHALKNSAALIGAMTISEEFKTLEYAARDNDFAKIEKLTEKVCVDYMELAEKLAKAFGGNVKLLERESMSPEELLGAMNTLKDAMGRMDIGVLNDTMEVLENISCSPEIAEQIGILSDAVLSLNSDALFEAVESIEKLL